MTNPTTDYVQNRQIDQLVHQFGSQLQNMPLDTRLLLRTILSQYTFGLRYIDTDYRLEEAADDCLASGINQLSDTDAEADLDEALAILEGSLTASEANHLIEALTAQLRPQLLGGRWRSPRC